MKKSSQTAGRSRRSQSNRRRKTQRKVRGGDNTPRKSVKKGQSPQFKRPDPSLAIRAKNNREIEESFLNKNPANFKLT
jgi:hypothetical protein